MMIHRRRLCLRRKDLTKKLNKRANDVLEKVRELFKEAELEILLHLDTELHFITTTKN